MKRNCLECNNHTVRVKLLTYARRMHCDHCFATFEYTFMAKVMLWSLMAIPASLAVWVGFFTQNVWFFGALLLTLPFAIEYVYAKFCPLKLTGLKALRKKIKNENNSKVK
jgi:hypothetical protein